MPLDLNHLEVPDHHVVQTINVEKLENVSKDQIIFVALEVSCSMHFKKKKLNVFFIHTFNQKSILFRYFIWKEENMSPL